MAIISTTNFKAYRSITASTWDTLIGTLISAAQAAIERRCSRVFDRATLTERYSGTGGPVILLKNAPVHSITSVKHVASDGTTTTLDTTTYAFETDGPGILTRVPYQRGRFARDDFGSINVGWGPISTFAEGVLNYEVVYNAGYDGTTYAFPADLQLVMYEVVDELFAPIQDGNADNKQLQSESLGDESYTRRSVDELVRLRADRLRPFILGRA